jgi:chorismate synthase
MLALVLMDHALRHRAQCGDVACPTLRIAATAPAGLREPEPGGAIDDPEPEED